MKIEGKNLLLSHDKREINFPYKVHAIGYGINNPRITGVKYRFSNQLEICLRITPKGNPDAIGKMILNGEYYEVGYPHVIVKIPNTAYEFRLLEERNTFYFAYSPDMVPAFREMGLFNGPLAWNITLDSDTNDLLLRLKEHFNRPSQFGAADQIDFRCFQLFTDLLLQRTKTRSIHDPEKELIMRVDSYLRLHFMDNIDLDELLSSLGISRTSFFRKWSGYFSVPPAKHLLELRLQDACRLLTTTRYKVCEIAQRVNIPDPAYFCAVFRKKYGMSPAVYRKNMVPVPKDNLEEAEKYPESPL